MRNIKVEYHKVVDILIFNDKHQLALQKRALSDKSFPGHWDFSAGGHIDRNEEAQKAAERESVDENTLNDLERTWSIRTSDIYVAGVFSISRLGPVYFKGCGNFYF